MVFVKRFKSHFRGNQRIKTKLGDSVLPEVYGFPLKGQERGMAFMLPRRYYNRSKCTFQDTSRVKDKEFSLTTRPGY